jgi:hypothetical protein
MRVTLVANGVDDLIDLWNNPWGLGLDDRIVPLVTDRGYQVLGAQVDYVYGTSMLGLALPYQLRVSLETNNQPATVNALVTMLREVITNAVGTAPTSVVVTSAGQTAPPLPSDPIDNAVNSTGDFITNLFGLAADTPKQTRILLWVAVIGAGALVYWVATNPEKGARLARGR